MRLFATLALSLLTWGLTSQLMAAPSPPTPMCPSIFQPASCTYEDFSASGTNRCFARINLQQILLANGVEVEPELIRCNVGEAALTASSTADIPRNPSIDLFPCVYSKLATQEPFERPGICKAELRNLLTQVRASPCMLGNPTLCARWIEQEAPRIERFCESESHEIARAIMSCLSRPGLD